MSKLSKKMRLYVLNLPGNEQGLISFAILELFENNLVILLLLRRYRVDLVQHCKNTKKIFKLYILIVLFIESRDKTSIKYAPSYNFVNCG